MGIHPSMRTGINAFDIIVKVRDPYLMGGIRQESVIHTVEVFQTSSLKGIILNQSMPCFLGTYLPRINSAAIRDFLGGIKR